LLGGALGPITKSIIEASAVLPMLKEVMRFTDADKLKAAFGSIADPAAAGAPTVSPAAVVMASPTGTVVPHAGQAGPAAQVSHQVPNDG
jgi:hypothetical protein